MAMGTSDENFRIIHCNGVRDFHIYKKILERKHFDEMLDTIATLSPNNEPRYKSNPHNCDIGELKIYRDYKGGDPYRCKILDLYFYHSPKRLSADILLIDEGQTLTNVWFDHIYDYSHSSSYCRDLEQEARPARLCLSDVYLFSSYKNLEIDDYFRKIISRQSAYKVKIVAHHDGYLLVDIISSDGEYISSKINQQFPEVMSKYAKLDQPDDGISDAYIPMVMLNKKSHNSGSNVTRINQNESDRTQSIPRFPSKIDEKKETTFRYLGALDYFRSKLAPYNKRPLNSSKLSRQFLGAKVISWYDPHAISIIPDDREYNKSHKHFKASIANLSPIKNLDEPNHQYFKKNKPFHINELVIFKSSSFSDENLSEWLRGIVVAISFYDRNNLSIGGKSVDPETDGKYLEELVDDGIIAVDDIVYRVRSIDYGYQCRSSHFSMRHLTGKDLDDFKSIGPWSLTCSLYGVYPLLSNGTGNRSANEYSITCIGMMDSWLRERILDNRKNADFHVIFHSDLRSLWTSQVFKDKMIRISLFHRYEPPFTLSLDMDYLSKQKRTYYHSLNWFLVESGLASDSRDVKERSSQVQLEECIVNKLVRHNML